MLVSPDMATMSAVVPVMAMMGVVRFAAAFATELAVRAASNMVFAFGAFPSFLQHVGVAEFIAFGRAAMGELVFAVHLVMLFAVLNKFVVNLSAVLLMLFRGDEPY